MTLYLRDPCTAKRPVRRLTRPALSTMSNAFMVLDGSKRMALVVTLREVSLLGWFRRWKIRVWREHRFTGEIQRTEKTFPDREDALDWLFGDAYRLVLSVHGELDS